MINYNHPIFVATDRNMLINNYTFLQKIDIFYSIIGPTCKMKWWRNREIPSNATIINVQKSSTRSTSWVRNTLFSSETNYIMDMITVRRHGTCHGLSGWVCNILSRLCTDRSESETQNFVLIHLTLFSYNSNTAA